VLPAIPFLPVLAAIAWSNARSRLSRPAFWAAALVLLQLGSAAAAWPAYLSYFNPASRLWGPPISLLDDSNLDWGQDLKSLKDVLSARGISGGYFCYFGSVEPADYGIALDADWRRALERRSTGVYAISAQCLIRLRALHPALFPPRTEFARAGDSIYLFKK
jgi:hypothetical protein